MTRKIVMYSILILSQMSCNTKLSYYSLDEIEYANITYIVPYITSSKVEQCQDSLIQHSLKCYTLKSLNNEELFSKVLTDLRDGTGYSEYNNLNDFFSAHKGLCQTYELGFKNRGYKYSIYKQELIEKPNLVIAFTIWRISNDESIFFYGKVNTENKIGNLTFTINSNKSHLIDEYASLITDHCDIRDKIDR